MPNETQHITASNINLRRLNNFKSQNNKHYRFIIYNYIAYINLTEIIIIFNFYAVTTQLPTLSFCMLVII